MGGSDVLMNAHIILKDMQEKRDYEERFRLLNERINQLEDELARFESKTGFMNAETMRKNARAWIVRNPRAWTFLVRNAVWYVQQQKHYSIKQSLEELRNETSIVIGDDDFKISNSYAAVFARELADEIPGLRPLITFRRSKVDRFYPWIREVNR